MQFINLGLSPHLFIYSYSPKHKHFHHAATIAGGILGVTLKRGIPEKCSSILTQARGVATIFIGISGTLQKMLVINGTQIKTQGTLLLIFSLVLGSLAGSLLDIEQRLEKVSFFLQFPFFFTKAVSLALPHHLVIL